MRYKVTIEQQEEENRWAESISGEVEGEANVMNLLRSVAPAFLKGPEDRIVLQVVPDAAQAEAPTDTTILKEEVE
jgi:hypothetical protein